jgi:hypothetical protein
MSFQRASGAAGERFELRDSLARLAFERVNS